MAALKSIPLWAKVAAGFALLIFLAFYFKSCHPSDYWKGQYDLAQEKVKSLSYTVNDLDKIVAGLKAKATQDEATWKKKVADAEGAIGTAQGQADSLATANAGLEDKLAKATTDAEKVPILQDQVKNLKAQITLKDTQLGESRKIIDADKELMGKKDSAFAELNLNYNKALVGWKVEKDANLAGQNLVKALKLENSSLRFQSSVGKVGLGLAGAAALYLLLSK